MHSKFSIITPTFNSEKSIQKNVDSVIIQTYGNFEHIIIDNDSIDSTLTKISESYINNGLIKKLKIISEKDNGIADAMNKGIQCSTGNVINILHSDDYYLNQKVLELVAYEFENDPNLIFAFGNVFFLDPKYGSIKKIPQNQSVKKGLPFYHQAFFIKREIFSDIGYFNSKYKIAMDFEFYCRLEKKMSKQFNNQKYLNIDPIVGIQYGGISTTRPIEGLSEVKRALKEHELWSLRAKIMLIENHLKSYLKDLFLLLKLKPVLNLLRIIEWNYFKPLKMNIRRKLTH